MVILERVTSKEAFMREVLAEINAISPIIEAAGQPVTITWDFNPDSPNPVGIMSSGGRQVNVPLPGTSRGEPIPRIYPRTQTACSRRRGFGTLDVLPRASISEVSPVRDPARPVRDPVRDPARPVRDPARPVRNLARPVRDPDIPAYQYTPETFNYKKLTLKQACNVMVTFDLDKYEAEIKSTLLSYSLIIHGLEECRPEDLRLAVFLFIERYFSFQPAIELCVRNIPDPSDSTAVGVLFERSETVGHIMNHRSLLDDTDYDVLPNCNSHWIIMNYED